MSAHTHTTFNAHNRELNNTKSKFSPTITQNTTKQWTIRATLDSMTTANKQVI